MAEKQFMWILSKKRVVRDPRTMAILSTEEPTRVPRDSYWTRRVRCGDCAEVPEPVTPIKQRAPRRAAEEE